MKYDNILVNTEGQLAQITINRPNKLNALNKDTIKELHGAFKQLEKDKMVRAIIITGSGEKAFVAGADIAEFANFSEKQEPVQTRHCGHQWFCLGRRTRIGHGLSF